jgi:hypothetical protein
MLCTFCGTENRPENKFCGMCGVRLERRQAERRLRQETLKCQSCGNVNDLGHKFCGMCGARIDHRMRERRVSLQDQPRASAIANAQLPTPEAPGRRVEPDSPHESPHKIEDLRPPAADGPTQASAPPAIFRSETPRTAMIGGPSFLGLGDEPPGTGEYLLDDEGHSGGMLRRLVLIAILAAIAGLIFVGWRSTLFRANPKSAPPSQTPPAASPSPAPLASPLPQSKGDESPSDPIQGTKAHESPEASNAQSDGNEAPVAATAARSDEKVDAKGNVSESRKIVRVQPNSAASTLNHPSATLLRAQQYLQGRGGVRQNCEQGLFYLKAATDKNEPAAAVQMGALYASGHCMPRNEVMAYRWFNSAHELEPANPWIQANLDQLWGRMTPQQRRQVAP